MKASAGNWKHSLVYFFSPLSFPVLSKAKSFAMITNTYISCCSPGGTKKQGREKLEDTRLKVIYMMVILSDNFGPLFPL